MAVTTGGIDKAEIGVCVTLDRERMADGRFAQTERLLPWVFVKFADDSETNRYVMPASNGLHLFDTRPFRQTRETMRSAGFPHELDAGPRPTDGDASKDGPRAIHFFAAGGV